MARTRQRLSKLTVPLLTWLALAAPAWAASAHKPALATGWSHTCSLTGAGAVQCWGENEFGQLGNGTTGNSSTPVAVSGLASGVVALAAGKGHTCALTSAGAVQCWGDNQFGQLGNGTHNSISRTPVAVSGLSRAVAIATGAFHTCALSDAGAVQCWGENQFGQLGNGTTANASTPVPVSGLASGVVAIAAGKGQSCALTGAGAVQCWGDGQFGQLGNGMVHTRSLSPVAVARLPSGVVDIAAGAFHVCALTGAGAVLCWGENQFGELGNGTTTDSSTPVTVSGLASGVVTIAAGKARTCALTNTGAVQCWGDNQFGQLGNGATHARSLSPVAVTGLARGVVEIGAGAFHSCARTSAGAVQCWGENQYGQLGNGTSANSSTPAAVSGKL